MREWISALLAGFFLLGAAAGTPARALTVKEYLEIARGENPSAPPEVLLIYVWGVADGLESANEVARATSGDRLYCPPGGELDFSVEIFKSMIDQEIHSLEREEEAFETLAADMPVGIVALKMLSERYPCP